MGFTEEQKEYLGDSRQAIGVFDSGVGGISVLAQLIRRMPQESYIYFGDSAHAPYGSRTPEEVYALTAVHTERLISMGVKAVVIACNTATGAAIQRLREKYSHIPIIGIEPAIKPAVLAHPGGRIMVLATPVTVKSKKFQDLMGKFVSQATILPFPCEKLAWMVENGFSNREELQEYLKRELKPALKEPIDAVVLGCTHYPFVKDEIVLAVGTDAVYDGGEGTARETEKQLFLRGMLSEKGKKGVVQILNSLEGQEKILLCERLLSQALEQN